MTKVEFTNWLRTEFYSVFNGDITPEQGTLNAIPIIDLFVSKNCSKPLVSGRSKQFYCWHADATSEDACTEQCTECKGTLFT